MKFEVKGLKDTLSSEQEKLKTLQTKYENVKENLKTAEGALAKSIVKVVELEKETTTLKNKAKKDFIQSTEFEEHLGQAIDAAVGDMIFTIFMKYPKFDYSCLGERVIELVIGCKQMA